MSEDTHEARAGARSCMRLQLPHGIRPKTPVVMLLLTLKQPQ